MSNPLTSRVWTTALTGTTVEARWQVFRTFIETELPGKEPSLPRPAISQENKTRPWRRKGRAHHKK